MNQDKRYHETDDEQVREEMETCLHCGGDGVEPFSDGEDCALCAGMRDIPTKMAREYYELVTEAMEDAG